MGYVEEGREKAREKRNVFSLDLNTVTESLLTAVSSRQPEQSIGKRAAQKSSSWKLHSGKPSIRVKRNNAEVELMLVAFFSHVQMRQEK